MIVIDIIGFILFTVTCFGFVVYVLNVVQQNAGILASKTYFINSHRISSGALLKFYSRTIRKHGSLLYIGAWIVLLLLILISSCKIIL